MIFTIAKAISLVVFLPLCIANGFHPLNSFGAEGDIKALLKRQFEEKVKKKA